MENILRENGAKNGLHMIDTNPLRHKTDGIAEMSHTAGKSPKAAPLQNKGGDAEISLAQATVSCYFSEKGEKQWIH